MKVSKKIISYILENLSIWIEHEPIGGYKELYQDSAAKLIRTIDQL